MSIDDFRHLTFSIPKPLVIHLIFSIFVRVFQWRRKVLMRLADNNSVLSFL